jgi:uncharacterized cupredoxin-like copper-binding protein
VAENEQTPSAATTVAVVAVVIACVALVVAAVALGYALRTPHSTASAPPRAAAPPAPATVAVAEQEYAIVADPASIGAGPAVFHVTNNGNATHEFVLLRTSLADGAMPRAADGRVDTTASSITVVAQAQNIVAGTSASVATTVTPGHYVMICNISGHYAAGMHAGFDVA